MRACFRGVTLFAVLACSLVSHAADAAILHVQGRVSLNNTPVQRTTSVQQGDLLATQEGSAALTGRGYAAQLAPHSLLEFRSGALKLFCGLVSVTTTSATAVRASSITVWPADSAKTQFRIELAPAKLNVIPVTGSVWINDGGSKKQLLHSGSVMTFPPPADLQRQCQFGTGK